MYSRIILIIAITFIVLAIPSAFIASMEFDENRTFSTHATLLPGEFKPLVLIFGSAEIYSGRVLNISLINRGRVNASLSISCMNETFEIMIKPENTYTVLNPSTPCMLTSHSSSDLEIIIITNRKIMPYKWLTIISLALFVAGTALMMTYAYQIIIREITNKSK
ncbi:MAG: hypothetical protein QW816_05360 [Desulfurococcaceae archaeon]